jgi:histidinol dehydrogenase
LELKTFISPEKSIWHELCTRPAIDLSSLEKTVSDVLLDVKNNGDKALLIYTKQFDKVELKQIKVEAHEYNAVELLDEELKQAIDTAAMNIRLFHSAQQHQFLKLETMPGVVCCQKAIAIEKVGLYIPGGTAPLFSTVLMLAIPAVIAGCKEIVCCTPPNKEGLIHPAILYAAKVAGVTAVYKIGGVQAIAAMAYGTETVPAVYKIFGPGNQYVTMAKQMVSKNKVAIDMPAGPSEVLVMIDETAVPSFVAADLLSQAEHGADSQVILVATNKILLEPVFAELAKQLDKLPRKEFALQSLAHSKAFVFDDIAQMIDFVNEYAPEHLIISMRNYNDISAKIINAGSVFLGNFTPESAGDYASGTNHTLPTNGFAKAFSGVNLDSYVKKITYQEITADGIQRIGNVIEKMARAELLDAHANAVVQRINFNK